jgi:hypothetical protein
MRYDVEHNYINSSSVHFLHVVYFLTHNWDLWDMHILQGAVVSHIG